MAARVLLLLLASFASAAWSESRFDRMYTERMRNEDNRLGRKRITCVPKTLKGCSEREVAFVEEKKRLSEDALKKETVNLIEEERIAYQSGKKPTTEDDDWMSQRKSIIYYLLDEAHKKNNPNERVRWQDNIVGYHDEL